MSSLISSLKSEIARVARKELKDELQSLRKASTLHRSEIAALKRQIKSLTSALKAASREFKAPAKKTGGSDESSAPSIRVSPERLAALRAKFGISQAQMAALIGVSYLSVHKWEAGVSHPRNAQVQKIAAVSKLGKREVKKKLEM